MKRPQRLSEGREVIVNDEIQQLVHKSEDKSELLKAFNFPRIKLLSLILYSN